MKVKTTTYRILKKAVALFLLAAMLLPSALQAKQLVDFCMMEMMDHHEMMEDSHDCCLSEANPHSNDQANHDCENGTICACQIDVAPVKEPATAPVLGSSAIIFSQTGFNFMVTSPDEFIHKRYYALATPDEPPLYLLYDTFLN